MRAAVSTGARARPAEPPGGQGERAPARAGPTYPTHTNVQRILGPLGVGVLRRPGLDGEAAHPPGQRSTPVKCGSRSDACPIRCTRRRRWRTFATTLALTLGSLAIPAAALADGQLDPTFNGTGYHVGTVAEGTVFNNTDTRIPMIVQANGSIVIGGSRGGFMTLARYTPAGALDTSFGVGGFATAQFSRHPDERPGQQRRHGHDDGRRAATSSSPASAPRSRCSPRASRPTAPSRGAPSASRRT